MKVTLQKIADDLGISKVSVFKALNNRKGVSDELKNRIIEYSNSIGYIKKQTNVKVDNMIFLYIVKKDFFLKPSEQYYSSIFYFLNSECNKYSSTIQLCFVEEENPFDHIIKLKNATKTNGLFIAGEINDDLLEQLVSLNLPTVVIDYYNPDIITNYVYVDNYHLSYSLTNYLIKNGHKKIGFTGDIKSTSSIADRYFGFQKAIMENDLPYDDKYSIHQNIESLYNLEIKFNEGHPTAYICHCDAAAQILYNYLTSNGFKIPEDISIISFDNTPLCDMLFPSLTSAGPKKDSYARKAFQVMINCINTPGKQFVEYMKPKFTKRNSVKNISL